MSNIFAKVRNYFYKTKSPEIIPKELEIKKPFQTLKIKFYYLNLGKYLHQTKNTH